MPRLTNAKTKRKAAKKAAPRPQPKKARTEQAAKAGLFPKAPAKTAKKRATSSTRSRG